MEKRTLVPVLVLVLIVGFAGGFFLGSSMGESKMAKLQSLVDLAFPKPPQETKNLTGTVQSIYGATITLEIDDPNDYLPHFDNTPRAKITVSANTSSQTKYVSIDYQKLDAHGNPTVTDFSLSDLKNGDVITVRSGQNIANSQKFDVSEVQLVRL